MPSIHPDRPNRHVESFVHLRLIDGSFGTQTIEERHDWMCLPLAAPVITRSFLFGVVVYVFDADIRGTCSRFRRLRGWLHGWRTHLFIFSTFSSTYSGRRDCGLPETIFRLEWNTTFFVWNETLRECWEAKIACLMAESERFICRIERNGSRACVLKQTCCCCCYCCCYCFFQSRCQYKFKQKLCGIFCLATIHL